MVRPETVAEIREAYLSFFAGKACTRVPSASLVPANDPTTLFTVAGMSQFKDLFLGRGSADYTRATTCQKCIRTNDILNVGRTPRHHTFFEMLGNFSFNDYFKRETITWAWEFLTQVLQLDPARLYVTVNHEDDEAWDIWSKELGFPEARMCRLGDDDNFWPASAPTQGPTGPGGYCSEIFWDFEPQGPADRHPGNDDGDRFVEIWNLVFPQFNVTEPKVDGRYTLHDLGRTNIDTGSGLERLACVVQGKRNNFDIDLFQTILARVAELTGQRYEEGASGDAEARNSLLRRIADHVRAVTFCITDGAMPSNTGRGYIVRRLIRRATLDSAKLGVEESVLAQVVGAVVTAMGEAYPEIVARAHLVEQSLQAEEESFRRTLDRGLDLFGRCLQRHRDAGATTFSGDDVFELFTTYGFPHEVTAELAEAEGLPIDQARFDQRMAEFADISKGGKQIEVFEASALRDAKADLGTTLFVGYHSLQVESELLMLEHEGLAVSQAQPGSVVRFALSQTPFYPEGGGQVADQGTVSNGDFAIRVDHVHKDEGLIIHQGTVSEGLAKPGTVEAAVDWQERSATARHHSVTHLLHAALGQLLGEHVEQQGSKVEADSLRFDFTHDAALSDEQLLRIEDQVNHHIAANLPVVCEEMPISDARAQGAKALFGEKYGSVVRVVRMGNQQQTASIELCGGCHVEQTGDIRYFRILREEAVAAGIRRIHALAGPAAEALQQREHAIAAELATLLATPQPADARSVLEALARSLKVKLEELPSRLQAQYEQAQAQAASLGEALQLDGDNLVERVRSLNAEQKRLRKQSEAQAATQAMAAIDDIIANPQSIADCPVYTGVLTGVDGKALRQAGERIAKQCPSHVVVLASDSADKAFVVVAASTDMIERGLNAGTLIGRLAPLIGGGGGGKPHFAQAGGRDPQGLPALMAALPDLVQELCAATTSQRGEP